MAHIPFNLTTAWVDGLPLQYRIEELIDLSPAVAVHHQYVESKFQVPRSAEAIVASAAFLVPELVRNCTPAQSSKHFIQSILPTEADAAAGEVTGDEKVSFRHEHPA